MNSLETKKYSMALAFAATKHAEQQRKDGTPYILHPVRVANLLAEAGYDVRYQIAGLFHDLLEDTDATEEELKAFCDEEMLTAIRLVTKSEGYQEETYIRDILENPMAKAVKNADRIDNLRDMANQSNEKFRQKYLAETEAYFYGKFSQELDALFERLR